jgi:hypothetical protein
MSLEDRIGQTAKTSNTAEDARKNQLFLASLLSVLRDTMLSLTLPAVGAIWLGSCGMRNPTPIPCAIRSKKTVQPVRD